MSGPQVALVPSSGLGPAAEAMRWPEARDLLGGETASEGGPAVPAVDASIARNADEANFGRDRVTRAGVPAGSQTLAAVRAAAVAVLGDVAAP